MQGCASKALTWALCIVPVLCQLQCLYLQSMTRLAPVQVPVSDVAGQLKDLGIEGGWGSTVGAVRSTMLMLGDIIQAPDPETLQAWP